MLKFALTLASVIPSTALFAAELPRGSSLFSACRYTAPTGAQADYQVDETVGVLDAGTVKGCPVGITYELGSTAVVYHLSVARVDSCDFYLAEVGRVTCAKK